MRAIQSWSLNRILVLLLLGGLASLILDIRWEHRVELGRQWQTWIPLVYIGAMLVVGIISLYRWEGWGPKVLQLGFGLALIVGLLGVWFHGGKDLVGDLRQIVLAWTIPLGTNGGTKVADDPPVIAPLAFVGLGLIGFLACSRRFAGDSSTSKDIAVHK